MHAALGTRKMSAGKTRCVPCMRRAGRWNGRRTLGRTGLKFTRGAPFRRKKENRIDARADEISFFPIISLISMLVKCKYLSFSRYLYFKNLLTLEQSMCVLFGYSFKTHKRRFAHPENKPLSLLQLLTRSSRVSQSASQPACYTLTPSHSLTPPLKTNQPVP